MRLTPKHRRNARRGAVAARIAISQEEITADLHYRGERAGSRVSAAPRRSGR
jgi:hypothetical protein